MKQTAIIEKSSGKSYCRGRSKKCIVGWRDKIPEGHKVLRVHISAAGGFATAFYCEECMKEVLDSFVAAINDSEKDVKEIK